MPTGDRLVSAAAYVVLFAVGLVLGTIEVFLVPLRIFGGVEGLVVVVAAIGNAALGLLAGYGLDQPAAPIAPGLGWFVAASSFMFLGGGGDVVVPGHLGTDPGVVWVGVLWYCLGVLGFVVALFLGSERVRTPAPPLHQAEEHAEV